MNKKHNEFIKAKRAIQYAYGRATCSVDGIIIMYRGIPLGEIGWKWWAYKVVRYMQTGGIMFNRTEKVIIEEVVE